MQNNLSSFGLEGLGQKLQAARKAKGFTQQEVADRLNIARTTLTAIEKGERVIRPDELVKMAQLYDESINTLLRQESIDSQTSGFIVQFRSQLAKVDDNASEEAVHNFQKLCEDYLYLENLTDSQLPIKYPPIYEIGIIDPVKAAENVATSERNRLGLGDGTIADLKMILENEVGIRIFGIPLPSRIAGLFACNEHLGACIATSTNHPRDRQLMSLLHEYGHFLTTRTKTDIVVLKVHARMPASERFADAFARYFLMPASGLQRRFHEIKNAKKGKVTPADLLGLADLYSVSFQALLFRLEELRLISPGTWSNLVKEKRFQVRNAQGLLDIKPKVGSGEIELPYRYRALAVEAWNSEKLTEGQLARILRTDRVRAREIVDEFMDRNTIDDEGTQLSITFEEMSYPIQEPVQVGVGGM